MQDILHLFRFLHMNPLKLLTLLLLVLLLLPSCNQLERVTKKLAGGLSEIISEAVDGVVQATIKIIFLTVLDSQEDGTQLLSFEAETPSGRAFKGVALGASSALNSAEVRIKGKAFQVQGEAVLLANAFNSEENLPLVMIAVETETLITQPALGRSLSDTGTIELVAQSLNKGNNSATLFRYIGETEKNLTLLGIGLSSFKFGDTTQGELLDWQAEGDLRIEGSVIRTSLGATLEADTELLLNRAGEAIILQAKTLSVVVQAAD